MANVTIYGPEPAATVRYLPEIVVRTKAAWAEDWVWAPRLRPVNAIEQAGLGSNATFELYYGQILEHGDLAFWDYSYEAYRGRFVEVSTWDYYGLSPLWVGYFPDEDIELWGRANLDSGKTTLRALGLDYLLRDEILEFPTEAGWIYRPLVFNAQGRRGWTFTGNRSLLPVATGHYVFSADKELWTNLDIAELLLTAYAPAGFAWHLTGETEALDQIVDVHQFYRVRLCDALDRLIDRRRGLGWVMRPSTAAGGAVAIHVYSTLADSVAVGEFIAPANRDQAIIEWVGSHDLQTTAHFSDIDRYRNITVLGGPIYSTFSLSSHGGGLEPGWTAAQEAEYKTAGSATALEADQRRAAQEFDRVYRYFRVPDDWNGDGDDGFLSTYINAWPSCDANGVVSADVPSVLWRPGKVFERWLPWTEEGDETGEPDYMQPFAYIKDINEVWQFADRLLVNDEEYFMRLSLADRELAVRIEGKRGHLLAADSWEGADPTLIKPVADYSNLGITVQLELDERLRVEVEVPDAPGSQTKTIEVPEAVVWYVTPGTVEAIDDGDLIPATGGILRDDSEHLRAIAALAKAWYGSARATLDLRIDKQITLSHPVGQLIRAALGSVQTVDVGTVVTRREWDFRAWETRIQTGFDELRFEDFPRRRAGKGKP